MGCVTTVCLSLFVPVHAAVETACYVYQDADSCGAVLGSKGVRLRSCVKGTALGFSVSTFTSS